MNEHHTSAGAYEGQRFWISWSYNYRYLWATWSGCWGLHPSARTHVLVTAESSLQFSDPNSFSSPSHYEQKAPIIARTTENCTNCSWRQGFLRGHDPTVSRELQTQHTGTASNCVQIWDIRGREVWVYYLGSLGRDCKAENTWRRSQVTPPLFW